MKSKVWIIFIVLLLAVWSAYLMYFLWPSSYLEGAQMQRMNDILYGSAPNPWRYRLLSEYIANFIYKFFQWFDSSASITSAFTTFTFLQFAAIYSLSYAYFRKLNISMCNALVGLAFIAGAVFHSYYDSGLSYSRNVDLIFYLIAALCIFYRNFVFLPIIVLLAALNRETSGFIILMPFAFLMLDKFGSSRFSVCGKFSKDEKVELIKYGVISSFIFIVTFILLRYFIGGSDDVVKAYSADSAWMLFNYNISDSLALLYLPLTFNILPLLGLSRYKFWPKELVIIYLLIVPAWLVMHLFYTYIHETSLFLVPLVMAFIPSALGSGGEKEE